MPSRRLLSLAALSLLATVATGCADSGGPDPIGGEITIVPGAVQQGSAGFTPNPLIVPAGDGYTVTWNNSDFTGAPATGTMHYLLSDEGLFDSGSVDPDQSFSFTFPGPGTYHYRCKNHLTMQGTITILD